MTDEKRIRVAVNGYGVIGKRVADAVAAQNDMDVFEARPYQPKMVEAMIERHADDRYVLIVHLGEVREAKPSRLMHLPEDHFLLGTMDRPPCSDPSLQCAPNAPIKLRVTATYLLENCH